MLVSNSHDFVFIRVPKAGSTSALFYFLKAGLYNQETDVLGLEGHFYCWQQLENHFKTHGDNYLTPSNTLRSLAATLKIHRDIHISYDRLVEKGWVREGMPCFATIRNPFKRMVSSYFYEKKLKEHYGNVFKFNDINEFALDACLDVPVKTHSMYHMEQHTYFPNQAKLWNTENLHAHAVADISALGGTVPEEVSVRKTEGSSMDYKKLLYPETIKAIELKYAKDFVLWEKAYAVYN